MKLPDLPETWRWVKLGEVTEIVGGGTPSRENSTFFGGGIPWATPTDITSLNDLWIYETKESITEEGLRNSSAKLLPTGTVLMTSRATIGFAALAGTEMATNQGFASFICIDRVLLNEYLAYYLPSIRNWLIQIAGGTTFKEISKSVLANIEIPLPTLPEQRRIVEILRQADALRRLGNQSTKKVRDYLNSTFFDLFGHPDPERNQMGWKLVRLGDYVDVATGGTPSRSRPDYYGGDFFWVKTTELQDRIIYQTEETITDLAIASSNAKPFPPETVLVAMYGQGQTRGRTAKLAVRASTNQACAALLPSETLHPNYLWLWFQNSYEYVRSLARGGPQANLNLEIIRNLRLPKPSKAAQDKFDEMVLIAYDIIAKTEAQDIRINVLGHSLLADAFVGNTTAVWRERNLTHLHDAAVQRDIALGLRGAEPTHGDYKRGRVTQGEREEIELRLLDTSRSAIGALTTFQPNISIPDFLGTFQAEWGTQFANIFGAAEQIEIPDFSYLVSASLRNAVLGMDAPAISALSSLSGGVADVLANMVQSPLTGILSEFMSFFEGWDFADHPRDYVLNPLTMEQFRILLACPREPSTELTESTRFDKPENEAVQVEAIPLRAVTAQEVQEIVGLSMDSVRRGLDLLASLGLVTPVSVSGEINGEPAYVVGYQSTSKSDDVRLSDLALLEEADRK